jgi:uncharacterized membrane protein
MPNKTNRIAHGRFKLFLIILVAGVVALLLFVPINFAIVLAFDAAALVFLASTVAVWKRGTPSEMRKNAARDDGGRGMLLVISTIVIGVILVALVTMIGGTATRSIAGLMLVVVTQWLAWLFANIVWAFHYAHLFYDPLPGGADHGGLSFPGDAPPEFSDFCYFSLVVGMTFQVSDVQITSPQLRKTVLAHAMVAFSYNLGVLALTVNLIASAF